MNRKVAPVALVAFLALCVNAKHIESVDEGETPQEKSGRHFSLFTIVNFRNEQCTTATSTTPATRGTCYSATECTDRGGTADGNCAYGFGVCCRFVLNECGTNVAVGRNCTYLRNPGFPASHAITAATTCSFSVTGNSDICQLRLDFDQLEIAAADAAGLCPTDDLTVAGPTGTNSGPPAICGTSTGQHMYIETGRSTTATTLTFNLNKAVAAATRIWNVKVSQIACGATYLAPQGCTQYFTGVSNTNIRPYNFGQSLQAQDYTTCVRQEMGMCSIQYDEVVSTNPISFQLHNNIASISVVSTACSISYLFIQGTTMGGPRFCGGSFTDSMTASDRPSAVTSTSTPFNIKYRSAAVAQTGMTGYSLQYNQIGC